MRDTDRFRRAREAWTNLAVPAERFRANDLRALTYGIECDLDHQSGYLTTLLAAFDRKDPHWDFTLRANSELRDLISLRERLASLEEHSPPYAPTIVEYMDATTELLEALLESCAVPDRR